MERERRNDLACHVYVHCYPDGTPFYVGIGKKSRSYNFRNRSKFHKNVQAKIRSNGGEVLVKIDCIVPLEKAKSREKELIAQHGLRKYGGLLVNFTAGGEYGTDNGYYRLSQSLIGNKRGAGAETSAEIRELRRKLTTERWSDPEYRRRVLEKRSRTLKEQSKDLIEKSAATSFIEMKLTPTQKKILEALKKDYIAGADWSDFAKTQGSFRATIGYMRARGINIKMKRLDTPEVWINRIEGLYFIPGITPGQ